MVQKKDVQQTYAELCEISSIVVVRHRGLRNPVTHFAS